MTHPEALEVLSRERGRRIVITTMGSVGFWHQISDSALDFAYIPSSMGQGPSLGLGLALAQPERGVIVVNGDGCTLMNLGCFVTLAREKANLFLIVIDNGLYEVTGGQLHAGAGTTDFAGIASAAGIERVHAFEHLEEWKEGAAKALQGKGPAVICLKVQGRTGQKTPLPPRPMNEQMARLKDALRR